MLGELGGPDLVGDVGQRVPPPARPLHGDALRVEDPYLTGSGARVAGGVDDVALVGGDQNRSGSVQDGGNRPARGLPGPRPPDVGVHVLPRPVQRLVAGDGAPDRHAGRVHAHPLGLGGGRCAAEVDDLAAAAQVGGPDVDARAPRPAPSHGHDDQPDQCRHERHGETQPHPAGSARPGQAPTYETEQHREGVGRNAHAVVGDRVAHVHGDVDGRAHDDHQPDDQPQEDQLLADAPRIATTVAGRRAHLLSSSDAPPMRDL